MSRVFVGLSGGVDSAVAAALLVEAGNNVTGVYMKNWSRNVGAHQCPWKQDLASARSVAAHLQIPFKIYDFEKEYYESVTKYMLDTYKKGQTPNPDVMCNQKIKFDTFYTKCLNEGAEKIATGHYAKIEKGKLITGEDESKDQTYFLYRINPKIAKNIMFPIGNCKKTEIRELAKQFSLPNYDRPDSQGLCFVGNIPMRDFLGEFIKTKKGDIMDEKNNKIGEHNGAFTFTIGQRHGLGIGGGQPYFVYKIDTNKNTVYVTTDENSKLLNKSEFQISDCVWWQKPNDLTNLTVKVRYRSQAIACTIAPVILSGSEESVQNNKEKDPSTKSQDYTLNISLSKPERAITPGQSAVLYQEDLVIGGGIIQ